MEGGAEGDSKDDSKTLSHVEISEVMNSNEKVERVSGLKVCVWLISFRSEELRGVSRKGM